jgi:hypothetical protein
MAIYSTLYGLPQSMVDYLNQPLPDISNLYTPPVAGINPIRPSPDDPQGIVSLYPEVAASGDGGDGFSPYDIRPGDSSIRTFDQYNPYAYRQAAAKSGFGIPSGILADSSYLYPQKTGIEQLLNKFPTFGGIKTALDALADKLPINRGAIFQNELLGQGIKLDNLGRIVTDNYNTPEGIMAGYNPVSGGLLNMITGGAYGEPTTYGLENLLQKDSQILEILYKINMVYRNNK